MAPAGLAGAICRPAAPVALGIVDDYVGLRSVGISRRPQDGIRHASRRLPAWHPGRN